ncbi:MAG TPA: alpha/beta hydrolase, partial [Tepidisphaeraceae bacterium]|nr:alpha/beta hydrolase [Tepidisphaeraceae bacterium]
MPLLQPATAVLTIVLLLGSASHAAAFDGKQSEWNGYPRFDFQCDGKPAIVVAPKQAAPGNPWLWRGEFFGAFATVDQALLEKGWHVAYLACPNTFGSPETMDHWAAFYKLLTEQHGLSKKPVLLGMSRGGLYVYRWAAAHPDKVGLIYGDAPVCDIKSWPGGKFKEKGSAHDWALFKQCFHLDEQQAMEWKGSPIDILEP